MAARHEAVGRRLGRPTGTVGDAPLGEVVAHDDWVTFAAARVFERFVGRAR